MSGTKTAQKGRSVRELLSCDDADWLDIKSYSSGQPNKPKSYCPPSQTLPSSWTKDSTLPVMFQAPHEPGISAKSLTKVKKDAVTAGTAQIKQHYNLKPLKFKSVVQPVDSKHTMSSAVSSQTMSTLHSEKNVSRDYLAHDDHISVDKQHLPLHMNSVQNSVKFSDTAYTTASQSPVTRKFLPSVVPMHLKVATKKDQFRKMNDYHTNVIGRSSGIHQHSLTGSDAVKRLEQQLQEV